MTKASIDCFTLIATDFHGLVMRKAGAEFLDGVVDEGESCCKRVVVFELELAEPCR